MLREFDESKKAQQHVGPFLYTIRNDYFETHSMRAPSTSRSSKNAG